MPRGKPGQESKQKQVQNRYAWDIIGEVQTNSVGGWDLKAEAFTEALCEIVGSGATVVLRPGTGGRSLGIAIWDGDVRYAPVWCHAEEEADAWARKVLERVAEENGRAAD
jgi:hypothetical protein